jgi:hypothetical protein
MNKKLIAIAVIAALTLGIVGLASTATAKPTKTISCSNCHKKTTKVKISVSRTSETSTTATYSIKVTGGSGKAGWAVLQSGTNLKHKTASTGSFTLNKGATYKVWAVKKGTGSRVKSLSPAL